MLSKITAPSIPTFFGEFFYDTARTVMSLTLSLTFQNFTHINYQFPHEGDAWPSVEDRLLKSSPPPLEVNTKQILNTRYISSFLPPLILSQSLPQNIATSSSPLPHFVTSLLTPSSLRVFYDSAGPVFYNQVKGLLGYGVPSTQLVLGTDYPYVPPFVPPFTKVQSIPDSILAADFLTKKQKQSVFTNAKRMFGGLI